MSATTRDQYVAAKTNAALTEYDRRLAEVRAIWAEGDWERVLVATSFTLATETAASELLRLEAFGGGV